MTANRTKPLAIDLFCGAGGMSLGFEQAGFDVLGALDIARSNVSTYNKNFPGSRAHVCDLARATAESLRKLCRLEDRSIDVLFGGPPCQGFSVGGKRDLKDARNVLIHAFARVVRELQPKYFVMENVAGLLHAHSALSLRSFLHSIRLAGYSVVTPIRTLNAADFGVPQRRHRTFILGCRTGYPRVRYPEAHGIVCEGGQEYIPNVKDAITDLPCLEEYDYLFDSNVFKGALGKPSHYARILRSEIVEEGDYSERRALPEGTTGCLRTRHSEEIVVRFRRTKPGTVEPVSRFHRLDPDGIAPTIRAGTGTDHGSHTAPRAIHPVSPRCITTREAARLHSFPDWFEFSETRWHSFLQVGNSVPPKLTRAVARQVIRVL